MPFDIIHCSDLTGRNHFALSAKLTSTQRVFVGITLKKINKGRKQRQNARKAEKKKAVRRGTSAKRILASLCTEFTFKDLCFPTGYSATPQCNHHLTAGLVRLAGLRSHILSIRALELLVKQQCFAIDALSLIGQTNNRMEGRIYKFELFVVDLLNLYSIYNCVIKDMYGISTCWKILKNIVS